MINFKIDKFQEKYLNSFDNEYFNIYKESLAKSIVYRNIYPYSFVGLIDDVPIAYLLCEKTYLSGIIMQNIYVNPEFRERGIARLLFNQAKDKIKSKDSIIVYYNKELRKFYEHIGFIIGDNLEVAIYPLNEL
jgi:GNAT superfamily N-acetyltransferase